MCFSALNLTFFIVSFHKLYDIVQTKTQDQTQSDCNVHIVSDVREISCERPIETEEQRFGKSAKVTQ